MVFWFAQYYYLKNQYGRAQTCLNRIKKDFPKSALVDEAVYWSGLVFYKQGDLDGAIVCFKEVINQYPNSDSVENSATALSDTLIEKGEYDQAIEALTHMQQASKNDDFKKMINKKIGDVYQEMGRFPEALKYLRSSLGNADNDFNAQIQFQIAECYASQGNSSEAVNEYLKVGYLFPQSKYYSTRAQLRCAQLFEAQNRWNDAKKIYEKLAGEDIEEAKHAKEKLNWINKHKEDLGL